MTESKFLDLYETICLWWPRDDGAEFSRSENMNNGILNFKKISNLKYNHSLNQIELTHINGENFWLEMEKSNFEISMSGDELTLSIIREGE